MPMADWLDKYPGVKALLQGDTDELESPVAEEEASRSVVDWTPETAAMAQALTQALVARIPFLLHIEVRLLDDRSLGICLRCQHEVEYSCGLTREAFQQTRFLEQAMEYWAREVTHQVAERQAAAWLATKQADRITGCFQDGLLTHRQALPMQQGSPPRIWRFPVMMAPAAFVGAAGPPMAAISAPMREYRLRDYDPITRVAWYEPGV